MSDAVPPSGADASPITVNVRFPIVNVEPTLRPAEAA